MPDETSSASSLPLPVLPNEVLDHITQYFDRSSAVTLAPVAPRFTDLSDRLIWRDLDLSSQGPEERDSYHYRYDHYDYDHYRHGHYNYDPHAWEATANAAFLAKAKAILLAGSRKRFDLVESMKIAPRPGAYPEILSIFGFVAPTLRKLEIEAPQAEHEYDDPDPPVFRLSPNKTLDVNLIRRKPKFDSLTSLSLGKGAVRYADFMVSLCFAAPGLIDLNAELSSDGMSGQRYAGETGSVDRPPYHRRSTRIQRMRLILKGESNADKRVCVEMLADFVSRCGSLRQLNILLPDCREASLKATRDTAHFDNLGDFYCQQRDLEGFAELPREKLDEGLRRLVLSASSDSDLAKHGFSLSRLDVLYLETSLPYPRRSVPPLPAAPPSRPPIIPPVLAASLRNSPNLRAISAFPQGMSYYASASLDLWHQLDAFEASPEIGFIASYCHGGSELLHLHARLSTTHGAFMPLQAGASAIWQDVTEFEGVAVPIYIIERMRVAQGARTVEWRKRGVEVGFDAWKVLTDWRAGAMESRR